MNRSRLVRLAAFGCLLVSGAGLFVLIGALSLAPLPEPPFSTVAPPTPAAPVRVDLQEDALQVIQAVALNPFRPDRQRAEGRYGHRQETTETYGEVLPQMRLTGIALGGRRSLALIVADGQATRLTGVGDTIGPYRIARIDSNIVWLAGSETEFALHLPDPTKFRGKP